MARAPQIRGGEYTLLYGPEGQEQKLFAYPTLPKARENAKTLLDSGMATRAVIVRPSGLMDEPDYREVIERPEEGA